MRYSELRRKLKKLGGEPLRQAGGSHEIWWRPGTDFRTVVPNHLRKDIPRLIHSLFILPPSSFRLHPDPPGEQLLH
jgi:hypothetical protein